MISVCIATYNGENFIREQIDSILCQLSYEDELVISDDGSTDKTIEIIQSYNDKRIKLFFHQKDNKLINKKLSSFKLIANNFENTLINAQGDYIFLSDQDDIWAPNKVTVVLSYLNNYDMTLSNYSIIDENSNLIKECFYAFPPSFSIIKNIIKPSHIGCCIAFRKEMLKYILPFPKSLVGHDMWISSIISFYGKCTFIDKSLQLYRRHGLNVSTSTEKSKNSILIKVAYRIHFVYHFIKRIIFVRKY